MGKNKPNQETEKKIESNLEKLPKTTFEQIDIDKETELVYSFMLDKTGRWSIPFDKKYPELRMIQKESKDKEECMAKYKEFIKNIHSRDGKQMEFAQEQIKIEWEKINSAFLGTLSEHFETDWPADRQEIRGYVSVLPAYPRFLDEYSFCIGYKDVSSMIEVSAHEILHFLWFKKWKEVFPETKGREYESPNLCWRLSEIMDPIILQCNPKIRELIKPKKWDYSSFKKIKIGNVGMTEHFKNIYLESVASGDTFKTTLKKLWEEAQKYEEEISNF
jgi:hypothetical protein